MKGKQQPVKIYEPLLEGKPKERLRKEVAAFEGAVLLYHRCRFTESRNILLHDLAAQHPCTLYSLYLDRIDSYLKNPPPPDWYGIFAFTTK